MFDDIRVRDFLHSIVHRLFSTPSAIAPTNVHSKRIDKTNTFQGTVRSSFEPPKNSIPSPCEKSATDCRFRIPRITNPDECHEGTRRQTIPTAARQARRTQGLRRADFISPPREPKDGRFYGAPRCSAEILPSWDQVENGLHDAIAHGGSSSKGCYHYSEFCEWIR